MRIFVIPCIPFQAFCFCLPVFPFQIMLLSSYIFLFAWEGIQGAEKTGWIEGYSSVRLFLLFGGMHYV
jgi:hypothetical protein